MVKIGPADDNPLKKCEEWGYLRLVRVIIYGGPATGRPMTRREFIISLESSALWPLAGLGQQTPLRTVGILQID